MDDTSSVNESNSSSKIEFDLVKVKVEMAGTSLPGGTVPWNPLSSYIKTVCGGETALYTVGMGDCITLILLKRKNEKRLYDAMSMIHFQGGIYGQTRLPEQEEPWEKMDRVDFLKALFKDFEPKNKIIVAFGTQYTKEYQFLEWIEQLITDLDEAKIYIGDNVDVEILPTNKESIENDFVPGTVIVFPDGNFRCVKRGE